MYCYNVRRSESSYIIRNVVPCKTFMSIDCTCRLKCNEKVLWIKSWDARTDAAI